MKQQNKYKLKTLFASLLAVLFFAACNEVEDYSIVLDSPVADFAVSDTSDTGLNGLLTFTNKSLNGVQYFWDFGDGTVSEEVEPMHSYTEVGTYTISMIAQNGKNGNFLTNNKTITVEVTTDPFAYFSVDTLLKAKKEVSFFNKSARASSYEWNFGDDSISTDENPVHIYQEGGRYAVTLTSKNDEGEEAVWTTWVTVLAPLLEATFDEELITVPEFGWSTFDGGTVDNTWRTSVYSSWSGSYRYFDYIEISASEWGNPQGVDDWLISPKVTYDGKAGLSVDIYQGIYPGSNPAVPIKIWIAKKAPESADDFTIMVEEVVLEIGYQWGTYEFSLKEHVSEGEEFYIGFHVGQIGATTRLDNIVVI